MIGDNAIDQAGQSILDVVTKPYSVDQFESDIEAMKPRFMDIWVVPGLMFYAAFKSRGAIGNWTRRAIFVGACYLVYRNYGVYKQALASLSQITAQPPATTVQAPGVN
jgi:hypothetical protein